MVNVAVIGTGNMGKHHVRNYVEIPGVKLVAIADLNEQARELATKFGCKYYKDYNEMLDTEQIDAVSIAVPTFLHEKIALDVISHGKHVLLEKPIAPTIEAGKRIIAAARKHNVILMIGHIERYNPAILKLKDLIDAGTLGDIMSITARRVGVFPPQIKDANVIIDLGIHDIDIINYLYDSLPTEIYSNSGRALASSRDDYAEIFLKYGKASAFIQVNWITPVKIRNLAVTGSKGYAEMNYITQELIMFATKQLKEQDDFGEIIKFGTPIKLTVDVEKEEPLKKELTSFIDCVKNRRNPEVSPEQALDALNVATRCMSCNDKKEG